MPAVGGRRAQFRNGPPELCGGNRGPGPAEFVCSRVPGAIWTVSGPPSLVPPLHYSGSDMQAPIPDTSVSQPPRRRSRAGSDHGFTMIEMLTTAGIICVLSAMTMPMLGNLLGVYKLSGDAHDVANSVAMAKMRAASLFTQTRLHVNIAQKSYWVETWVKTGTPGWVAEGGTNYLQSVDSFGFGSIATAPPNTQTTIAQAPACLDNAGGAIAGSSCIVFNSRGLPVDATGAPIGIDAIYLTDGSAVFGATVSATGMLRLWRTPAQAAPVWALQ